MRLLHLSDLHLGKYRDLFSLQDQRFVLKDIVRIIDEENIDLVMIAGDIFDTSIPSAEALSLYSDFLEEVIFGLGKKFLP